MGIKQLWSRSRLARVKTALESYASLGLLSVRRSFIRMLAIPSELVCPPVTMLSSLRALFTLCIPSTTRTIDFTLIQSQWIGRTINGAEASTRCASRKSVMWAGEKCAGKSSIWPIDSARRQKWNIFFIFILSAVCLLFMCWSFFFVVFHFLLSAIFNFFLIFFFFLHHRSQLKHIFLFFFLLFAVDSSRETVSLSRFSTSTIILQFCNFNCFREWRARNGKCELKTNEIWSLNSIGMRWNFHRASSNLSQVKLSRDDGSKKKKRFASTM